MNQNSEKPTISVTADAVSVRKPDVAYVSLYVKAEGILLEDAIREATVKSEEVLRALRDTCRADLKEIYLGFTIPSS